MRLLMLIVCGALAAAPRVATAESFDVARPFLAKRDDGSAFVYTVSSSSAKDLRVTARDLAEADKASTKPVEWRG
jgi:hypothetical protein